MNKTNNWDNLISELGVEPPAQQPVPPASQQAAAQPPKPKPKPEAVPRSPKPSADWSGLANQLGITPPPPIEPQTTQKPAGFARAEARPAESRPPERERPAQDRPAPERPTAERSGERGAPDRSPREDRGR